MSQDNPINQLNFPSEVYPADSKKEYPMDSENPDVSDLT
jgi:hypothetical protein